MRLLLFDIDGTLLRVRRETSRRVVATMLRSVLNVDSIRGDYDFHGKTDRQIMRELARIAGAEPDDETVARMEASLVGLWESELRAAEVELMPGVVSLLEILATRDDVRLALVTGNLERGARLKLEPHRLNGYFATGAFGSDSEDRRALPPLALARAGAHYGRVFAHSEAVVIGDSHRDIDCARANGLPVVAVATGQMTRGELCRHEPDLLLESLEDIDTLFTFLFENDSTNGAIGEGQ